MFYIRLFLPVFIFAAFILTAAFVVADEGDVIPVAVTEQASDSAVSTHALYRPYRLGPGDSINITVYGEDDLSGTFHINGTEHISLPLIGKLKIGGLTLEETEAEVTTALKQGFIKEPYVSVDIITYRPFYILGEIKQPGSYEYVDGINALNAVAISGGFTYRANEKKVEVLRRCHGANSFQEMSMNSAIMPGDIIRIKERFF